MTAESENTPTPAAVIEADQDPTPLQRELVKLHVLAGKRPDLVPPGDDVRTGLALLTLARRVEECRVRSAETKAECDAAFVVYSEASREYFLALKDLESAQKEAGQR